MTRKIVEVYVCPTPGCPDYFGAAGMPDLRERHTGPKDEDRHQVTKEASRVGVAGMRHSRAECPTCRGNGVYVDRVRIAVGVEVPEAIASA